MGITLRDVKENHSSKSSETTSLIRSRLDTIFYEQNNVVMEQINKEFLIKLWRYLKNTLF